METYSGIYSDRDSGVPSTQATGNRCADKTPELDLELKGRVPLHRERVCQSQN